MTRFETTTCYHCASEGTSREHVPPKCLFPKGEEWPGLVTVPSCEKHNNGNSQADEYLKFLLGASSEHIPSVVRNGVARGLVRLAQLGSRNLDRFGLRLDNAALVIENDFPIDFELLNSGLEKVARALYFYHHSGRRKLLGSLQVWPVFIPIDPENNPQVASAAARVLALTQRDFQEQPRHGSHQEIFNYQVIEDTAVVVINMEFYGAHRVSVMGALAERSRPAIDT